MKISMYETILIFLFICILTLLLVYVFRCKNNTESFITRCHLQSEAFKKCMDSDTIERKLMSEKYKYIPQSNNNIPQSNNNIPEIVNNDKNKVLENMSLFIDNSREIFEMVKNIGNLFDNMKYEMSNQNVQYISDAKIMEIQNMKLKMDSSIENILQIIPRDYMFGDI